MSNYTKATDFAAKDALPSGDAAKVIKGAEFEDEFDAIATAVNSKADTASPTFTGTATLPTAAVTTLSLGGTTITSTGAELNFVDGVTSNIQTQLDAKGTVSSLSDLSVTATAAELNKLDGVTATTAELNLVDGLTAIADYSTGTFTPVVADAASGGNTATVGTANGRYTKIGRMVHVTIQLVNITTTGMSGSVYVRDLPFTAYDSGSPNMLWMGTLYASQGNNWN